GKSLLTVVPTRREGLARCMIESLACGTPVVSFDVTSAREILEGYDCGVVIPQGRYKEMADAILRLLGDIQRYEVLSENGSKLASELFAVRQVINIYESIYLGEAI
ncbi:MAG: glycosyltransferase family 4 protein, partial [Bacteroidota bacterium]